MVLYNNNNNNIGNNSNYDSVVWLPITISMMITMVLYNNNNNKIGITITMTLTSGSVCWLMTSYVHAGQVLSLQSSLL